MWQLLNPQTWLGVEELEYLMGELVLARGHGASPRGNGPQCFPSKDACRHLVCNAQEHSSTMSMISAVSFVTPLSQMSLKYIPEGTKVLRGRKLKESMIPDTEVSRTNVLLVSNKITLDKLIDVNIAVNVTTFGIMFKVSSLIR